jgi:hypothetical protein
MWFSKLLCKLGLHGPVWLGNESQLRSDRTGALVRQCEHCKTLWVGELTETRHMMTYGNWKRVR